MPFAALIERGLVTPGVKLVDAKKRHKALVRADGAVSFEGQVGSIHKIGALAQGLDACNGWTFWHVETPKGLRLIDEFRAQVRAEMAEAAGEKPSAGSLPRAAQARVWQKHPIRHAVGAAGFQRNRAFQRSNDGDAGVAGRSP